MITKAAIRVRTAKRDHLRVHFGPHYFVDIRECKGGAVTFKLGCTHHGFKADASDISGELERFINEIRDGHPESRID